MSSGIRRTTGILFKKKSGITTRKWCAVRICAEEGFCRTASVKLITSAVNDNDVPVESAFKTSQKHADLAGTALRGRSRTTMMSGGSVARSQLLLPKNPADNRSFCEMVVMWKRKRRRVVNVT